MARESTGIPPQPEAFDSKPDGEVRIVIPHRLIFACLTVAILATACGVLVLSELAFRRWSPWVGDQGMGGLVAWVWLYHVLAIVRRRRSLISGLVRAFAFAGGTGALIAGALYIAQH